MKYSCPAIPNLAVVLVAQVTSVQCVLTVAMMDTLYLRLAQINFSVKANCLAPVVLLLCDKRELSERMCWAIAKIFELCKWAAKRESSLVQ